MLELAVIMRYLQALEELRCHPSQDVRAFRNDLIATLSQCPISEVLTPIHTLPAHKLTPNEQLLRSLALSR